MSWRPGSTIVTRLPRRRNVWAVSLIFYTWNFQGLDYKCKSALEKRLGTTF